MKSLLRSVCVLALVAACNGAGGSGDGATASSSATGLAAMSGLGTYTATWDSGTVTVQTEAPDGPATITLESSAGSVVANWKSKTGTARITIQTPHHDAESVFVRRTFEEGGKTLILAMSGPEGSVTEASLLAKSTAGKAFGSVVAPTPDGLLTGVKLMEGGKATATPFAAQYLIEAASLEGAFTHETLRLNAALMDPAFLDAVAAQLETMPAESPGKQRGALHLSDSCTGIRQQVRSLTKEVCKRCANLDPDLSEAIPRYANDYERIGAVSGDCIKCAKEMSASTGELLRCISAWQAPDDVWTNTRCVNEQAGSPWTIAQASADGHGCVSTCVDQLCEDACVAVDKGYEGGSCNPAGDCMCYQGYADACDSALADALCGSGIEEVFLQCPAPFCGDGSVTDICALDPSRVETCDPSALPTGCSDNETCATDCGSCKPCECDSTSTPTGCPGDQICYDGCNCGPKPGCATDPLDFFLAAGAWCDPAEPAAWCGTAPCLPNCRCQTEAWQLSVTLANADLALEAAHIFQKGDTFGAHNKILKGQTASTTVTGRPGDTFDFQAGRNGTVIDEATCTVGLERPASPMVRFTGSTLMCEGW